MPTVSINDAELFYAVSGSGEPLLLIPGLGLDHRYYRRAIPMLSQSNQFIVDAVLAAARTRRRG